MRILGWGLVALALVNAGVFELRRSVSRERAALVERATERSQEDARVRAARERAQALGALVAQARETTRTPGSIGELRETLLSAADGLPIVRLSLDFRPTERVPAGFGGSSAQASFQGSFDALYQYLDRVERMYLPLAPENLSLRGDGAELTLAMRWAALWPLREADPSAANLESVELSGLELEQLSRWLSREFPPALDRDPFTVRSAGAAVAPSLVVPAPAVTPPKVALQSSVVDAGAQRPVLTGFVLARPELEPDVRRRVLAALRYAGEVHLLMVGDTVGEYRIDSMQARDSVTLRHAETGERIHLTFED